MLIQVWMFMEQLIGINHYNDQKRKIHLNIAE